MSHPPSSSSPASFFPLQRRSACRLCDCQPGRGAGGGVFGRFRRNVFTSRAVVDRSGRLGSRAGCAAKRGPSRRKKKTCQTSAQGCKVSVVFAADPTNHGSIDRPLSGRRVSSRLGDSVSTPRRHSFQSECAAERVFKNSPSALREQLLSGVIKTEAEGDVPRSPAGWGAVAADPSQP